MRITGAHRDGDIITLFHKINSVASAELMPRTVINANTIIQFAIGSTESHASERFQRVYITLISGPRLDLSVRTSNDEGRTYDIGLLAMVADMLTAAMR